MRRDLDLVRWILLKLESDPPLDGAGWPKLELTDRSEAEISYHVGLLHREGLVGAINATTHATPRGQQVWKAMGLTPLGHQFAEAAGNAKVWRTLRARIGGPFDSLHLRDPRTAVRIGPHYAGGLVMRAAIYAPHVHRRSEATSPASHCEKSKVAAHSEELRA